jgi:uncharacterized pyridoxal phosphate-containing UPF0001 family protein
MVLMVESSLSVASIFRYEAKAVVVMFLYISMVDAVDSLKLLKEINKQAAKHDRVIDVLLELHIAQEATKYGLTIDVLLS